MFSVRQKRLIADAIQKILRDTGHPELPKGEIEFHLHVCGADVMSWADIRNNGAVPNPGINPHNEAMDTPTPEPLAVADRLIIDWWKTHRPIDFSMDDHLNNPHVNLGGRHTAQELADYAASIAPSLVERREGK